MRTTTLLMLAACLAVAACGDDAEKPPKHADIFQVMPELPLPPDGKLVGRAGSEDALQLTFQSSVDTDQMAAYYRGLLGNEPWRLVSDLKQPDGSVMLYAERSGQPSLWVRISAPDGVQASGSLVELAGGAVAKAPTSDSAAGAVPAQPAPRPAGARRPRGAPDVPIE